MDYGSVVWMQRTPWSLVVHRSQGRILWGGGGRGGFRDRFSQENGLQSKFRRCFKQCPEGWKTGKTAKLLGLF
jgi:hypothetical protein